MRNDPSDGGLTTQDAPGVPHEPAPMGRPMQQPTYEPFTPTLPHRPRKLLGMLCITAVVLAGLGLVQGLKSLTPATARAGATAEPEASPPRRPEPTPAPQPLSAPGHAPGIGQPFPPAGR
ncbi:MAG: hypothetical protein IPJ41_10515 [Phycisphaerales bacterium]|nr:hypothetical protein [Phycisphaerales bacterium]